MLSEGLNLQDATRLINYDLHWNPVRLMQRIGRVDRRMNSDIEEQINLVALAWLGRGTYDKSEWSEALKIARQEHNNRTAQYLLGLPLLGDYLEEGLSQFGRRCSDESDTR